MAHSIKIPEKILISAYACNPSRGSEAILAWNWIERLAARNYEVWIITREINRDDIEKKLPELSSSLNIHFIYYENAYLLPLLKLLKVRFRYIYYYVWQWYAYKLAAKHHKSVQFDSVHHITWVQVRMPSFMWRLGIPFIFGPVGGGEKTPWRLLASMGLRQCLIDLLRNGWTLLSMMDPFVRLTSKNASKILVTSKESLNVIPESERAKCLLQLAIAYQPEPYVKEEVKEKKECKVDNSPKIIYVGRFLGWKGMSMGLVAFSRFLKMNPDAKLTMIGSGPAEKKWKKLAEKLQITGSINWIDWMPHNEVMKMYETHDFMLFPSLHDSGGFVVLEAMSKGLPVVCLDLGGPGIVVNDDCGIKVAVEGLWRKDVEDDLFNALNKMASDVNYRNRMSTGAIERINDFNWDALVNSCYGEELK